MTNGTSSSREVWKGEEYASAEFIWAAQTGANPPAPSPYWALDITIHRYVSLAEVQKDLERGFRSRPAVAPPKEGYKGAALYRYGPGANVICQCGLYIIEISPLSHNDFTDSLVMKALDIALGELNAVSSKPK
jgi:hypothetical protein